MSQVIDTESLFETNSILAGNTGMINHIMEKLKTLISKQLDEKRFSNIQSIYRKAIILKKLEMATILLSLERINNLIVTHARDLNSRILTVCTITEEADDLIQCKPLLTDLNQMKNQIPDIIELSVLADESQERFDQFKKMFLEKQSQYDIKCNLCNDLESELEKNKKFKELIERDHAEKIQSIEDDHKMQLEKLEAAKDSMTEDKLVEMKKTLETAQNNNILATVNQNKEETEKLKKDIEKIANQKITLEKSLKNLNI